ncbi:MAG: hypothetical protein CMH60_05970 [Myxococcales bacterium]|nr:hypothetical protein [Myxococcales bacterium]
MVTEFLVMSHAQPTKILFNASFVLPKEISQPVQAIGIRDGRISDIFSELPEKEENQEWYDCAGGVVVPGIVDAHFHLRNLGHVQRQVALHGAEDVEDIAARLYAYEQDNSGEWLLGRGWDQNLWSKQEFPRASALDTLDIDKPIYLTRVDGHAAWVNTKALQAAGITETTEDPLGGLIVRDDQGQATGILIDTAMELVQAVMPVPSDEEIWNDFKVACARCVRLGISGVHDMGTAPQELAVLKKMEAAGELPLRVTSYLYGEIDDLAPYLEQKVERQGLVRVVGVKLFVDGALGSWGAAFFEPYHDKPGEDGLILIAPEDLDYACQKIQEAGYQIAIHAIGDRAVSMALDAIDKAQGEAQARHRVEHAQVIRPSDRERFIRLGAIASMQPCHAVSDMPWVGDRLGPERVEHAYTWQTLIKNGVPLALGSDAPVESEDPWWGFYTAVNRQDLACQPDGGWHGHESLSAEQTLHGFTRGAAYASGDEDLGEIRVGALADLTVVDRNPLDVKSQELREIRCLQTWVNGHQVFQRNDLS